MRIIPSVRFTGPIILTLLSILLSYVPVGHASNSTLLSHFFSWKIQKYATNPTVCEITAHPLTSKFHSGLRNAPFFTITYKKDYFTIALYGGFVFDAQQDVTLIVGGRSYVLQKYRGDFARTYSSTQDVDILNDLLASSEEYFKVTSYSFDGSYSMDYYAVAGLRAAVNYTKQHC